MKERWPSFDEAVDALGRLDIVVANAGIGVSAHTIEDPPERDWHEILDVNLTGAFLTCKAAIPHVIATGDGGAVVIIGSGAALEGVPNVGHYVAAKHAIVGLGRSLANELAPHSIRVNTVHPGNCNTDMIMNPTIYRLFCPDVADPGVDDLARASQALNALPVPRVEPRVSNAVLWLASDEARYVKGVSLPVDAGWSNKWWRRRACTAGPGVEVLSHRLDHLRRVGPVSISDDDINEQPADDALAATVAADADGTDSADSDGTDGDGDADGTDGTDGDADGTDGDADGTDGTDGDSDGTDA